MTHLYRHYDATGALLYVGISASALERLKAHRTEKHWAAQISWIKVEDYPSRVEAERAERLAIYVENPIYNRQRLFPFQAPKAQLDERRATDAEVVGSNPIGGTKTPMTAAERQAARRARNREAYNEYMRKYRARLKEGK